MLDGSDSFEARDGDVDLWRRARTRLVPVGPGVRHPSDGELHNLSPYLKFPLTSLYAHSWGCTLPSSTAWYLCWDTWPCCKFNPEILTAGEDGNRNNDWTFNSTHIRRSMMQRTVSYTRQYRRQVLIQRSQWCSTSSNERGNSVGSYIHLK